MSEGLKNQTSEGTDFANGGNGHMASLQQVKTEGSITITPEMFERMYLSPENRVHGDLRRTFGNPTPIGLGGFLIAYCPIIFSLLGWRGYGPGRGAATVGTYYFSGGMLAIFAMIFEFLLGNSFPATFFGVFGAYFFSYGATLTPSFDAYLAYDPSNPTKAAVAPPFLAGLGFWNLMMGIFTIYCAICALRTNILFCSAFFFLALTFILVAISFWLVQDQKTVTAMKVQLAGASFGFVVMVIGWYLLLALMLSTVQFPFNMPVGDLSTVIPGYADKQKKKGNDVEKQS